MSASARLWSDMPSDRAGRLAYFQRRIDAAVAADPLYAIKLLYAWSDPDLAKRARRQEIIAGKVVGLSEHHELLRRCFVLRAWCARRLGANWRRVLRADLYQAGVHRRLAQSARLEGR